VCVTRTGGRLRPRGGPNGGEAMRWCDDENEEGRGGEHITGGREEEGAVTWSKWRRGPQP
jgi:hypothetical protein